MEPRVVNLLLSETVLPAERNGLEHLLQYPSTAVFPSSTLPAIRPLHEDQSLESRDFSNEIDSLQLREIDWDALESPIYARPGSSRENSGVFGSGIGLGISRGEDAQVNITIAPGTVAVLPPAPQAVKKSVKSAAPIAGVLNSISPEVRNEENFVYQASESRKRRRLDAPSTRILPKPSPSTKTGTKRQRMPPLLPPLLVPLHQPPPEARIIPSINTDGFRERSGELPTPEARRTEREHAFNVQTERADKSGSALGKQTTVERPVVDAVTKPVKNVKGRNKWTEEETAHLLRGVARLGIGSWKKILQDPDYDFNGRTAVDLKDRFRTCCPDEYRKTASNKPPKPHTETKENEDGLLISVSLPTVPEKISGIDRKGPEELAKLGISAPFPKSQRRARRGFTAEEDEALLRGFSKYGAQWTKIRSDPELGLTSRRRTDLRDRFRNRYPEKFVETGHRFHRKLWEEDKDKEIQPPPSSDPNKTAEKQPITSPYHVIPSAAPAVSAKYGATQYSLRLLTSSMADPFFPDYDDLTPDDDDPETITLSRNIFDWADQQSNHNINKTAPPRTDPPSEPSKTLSRLDQFNINPMLALKVPQTSGLQRAVSASSLPNLFPPLPLSGILNGPISLPPPADLVSGHDAEGRIDGLF
ncbi:hypothetical protein EJ08DRAFT_284495 [Tothia fuscella]|uniref:Uncharacterized protein n=1 Tax=Tothia fuscella TaxID=1048955 RepID=A0A9P4U436_9PEZI|nr:hypothetical protein EJ08DRAFT_284495 [Tothia fuscella]